MNRCHDWSMETVVGFIIITTLPTLLGSSGIFGTLVLAGSVVFAGERCKCLFWPVWIRYPRFDKVRELPP